MSVKPYQWLNRAMKLDITERLIFLWVLSTCTIVSPAQQAFFITEPSSTTLCLTQSAITVFTSVINRGSNVNIDSIGWYISVRGGEFESVEGRPRHMINNGITSNTIIAGELTVTEVTVNDNGTRYRCQPNNSTLISSVATLTVLHAPPIDSITVVEACENDFTVSWTTTSSDIRLSYNVTLSPPSSVPLMTTMNNSYNITGLIPNTTYSITIRAGESTQCLGAPATMMITTPRSGPVVRNVLMLRNLSRTNTSITVTWNAENNSNCGPVTCYIVTIENSSFIFMYETPETTSEFSGLMSGTSYTISVRAINRAGIGPGSDITLATLTDNEEATRPTTTPPTTAPTVDTDNNASLSTELVAFIAAVSSCVISVVLTAIITFVITAYYYKRKYSNKPTMVTQPVVNKTDVVEYEEITKTSPDNMAMTTNPSYDVAMSSNPAYGHNVKKIDQVSDYYN